MIAVTHKAASAIRQMTNTDNYPDAGLRIRFVDHNRFAVAMVPHPRTNDVALNASGANVYLDHAAAEALEVATLDADDKLTGAARFKLTGADTGKKRNTADDAPG